MVDPGKQPSAPSAPSAANVADASKPRAVFSLSEEETLEFGRAFGARLEGGQLVILEGELGLGKTVFARGLATGLGVSPEDVTSPSFTLVQEYGGGRLPLFHIDLYRLETVQEMQTLGLEEFLTAGAVVVVEWGEKLPPYMRRGALTVRFHDVGEGSRRIELLPATAPVPPRTGDA